MPVPVYHAKNTTVSTIVSMLCVFLEMATEERQTTCGIGIVSSDDDLTLSRFHLLRMI